ncbi:hypothetical protein FH972_021900 [Carpinus fangiana]|uniref:Ribosomal RNA-processing protein 42 n=1 Tax=Carpinus fangiana TaxID=176857 RepID=A0A5N6KR11_9ROSI|nr:hypothetical protein FH972_021900 [Carpinus fangiana]
MAPSGTQQILLSPPELHFLSSSLSQTPPIRPDLRSATQFRPLVAETNVLPSTNGSARVCFSDGTEAVAGVKLELERSPPSRSISSTGTDTRNEEVRSTNEFRTTLVQGSDAWLEVSIEIPGFRDDESLPMFLAAMLSEALLANGNVQDKLWINDRWHWKLYIDILSLSPPLSYPLPLLSLTTHMALLSTALPRLKSDPKDDPLFDDDWAAAVPLFPRAASGVYAVRPPITLLVITIGDNIIFDPTKEELAVANGVVAVSVAPQLTTVAAPAETSLELVAIRFVDPPSRLTPAGILNSRNPATAAGVAASTSTTQQTPSVHGRSGAGQGQNAVWSPPCGGLNRKLLAKIMVAILQTDGVAFQILEALAAVEIR